MPRATTRRSAVLTGLAALAVSAATLTAPVLAEASPTAPAAPTTPATGTVTHANTLSPAAKKLMKGSGTAAEAKAVSDYWTPARMKAAKPVEQGRTFKHAG